jgi:hypothetical protein
MLWRRKPTRASLTHASGHVQAQLRMDAGANTQHRSTLLTSDTADNEALQEPLSSAQAARHSALPGQQHNPDEPEENGRPPQP